MAKNQAIQINAPLAKDIWKNVNRIVIKNNVAEHDAIQINYTNPLENMMELMTLRNNFKIAAQQNKSSRKRRDSVMSPP
jgi:pyruvate/2-oxoglutarate dehydrogenase complex dihydrolipoamide acyltransferase (E2) component